MDVTTVVVSGVTAVIIYGLLTILYKPNPLYDSIEGFCFGCNAAGTVVSQIVTIESSLVLPLTTNFANQWWLLFGWALGLCFISLYFRKYIELFRFASAVVLAVNIAQTVRSNAQVIWSEVSTAGTLYNISYVVLWLFFIGGIFYYIYARKLEKPLAIPREIGRWIVVFELGAVVSPLYMRYVDTAIYWTITVQQSPCWWVPIVIGVIVLLDAANNKYGLFGKKAQVVEAKT